MSGGRRAYDLLRAYVNNEWERIKGIDLDQALKELDAPSNKAEKPQELPQATESPPADLARSVLGVSATASFEEIRVSFEKLNERSDPAKFPDNTPEQEQAAQIQRRINWASHVLTADVPTTEKRFKSLEIE